MLEEGTRPGLAVARALDGIREIAAAAWDAVVAPGQGPISHGYYTAFEQAELPDFESRPVVAFAEDGRVAAASPAYFYDLDMGVVHSPFLGGTVGRIRRLLPRFMIQRVFEIGSPTPLVVPFLCATDVDPEEAADAVLAESVREAFAGGAQFVIAQNFESAGTGAGRALRRHGFSPVPIPPTVVVELPFATFDEYLDSMRAQYRRRARKVLAASAHLHVEHVRDFGELSPELTRLWLLVYDRAQEVKREVMTEAFFRAVARVEGSSILVLRRDDGSIASYALLLDDQPWLHFLYTGFAEEAGREESAYFRLIYEIVRHAIEHDFPSVNLGITTLEPKLDAGGVPVQLYAWLRHRRPLLQKIFASLGSGHFAPRTVEARNVFKR